MQESYSKQKRDIHGHRAARILITSAWHKLLLLELCLVSSPLRPLLLCHLPFPFVLSYLNTPGTESVKKQGSICYGRDYEKCRYVPNTEPGTTPYQLQEKYHLYKISA